jgi:hypothetical protein
MPDSNWRQGQLCRALRDINRTHPAITDPDAQVRMINAANGWTPPVNVADVLLATWHNGALDEQEAAAIR